MYVYIYICTGFPLLPLCNYVRCSGFVCISMIGGQEATETPSERACKQV